LQESIPLLDCAALVTDRMGSGNVRLDLADDQRGDGYAGCADHDQTRGARSTINAATTLAPTAYNVHQTVIIFMKAYS
jgi:hypothetical protein